MAECVLEWVKRDKAPRATLACAALVTAIDEHLLNHNLRAICDGLALLVALWPGTPPTHRHKPPHTLNPDTISLPDLDEDRRSSVVQCTIRVMPDPGRPNEKAHSTVHGLIQQQPDLLARVSATIGRSADRKSKTP